MFLKAVLGGFGLLSSWQVLLGAAVSALILITFTIRVGPTLLALNMIDFDPTSTRRRLTLLGVQLFQCSVTALFFSIVLPPVAASTLSVSARQAYPTLAYAAFSFIGGIAVGMAARLIPILGRHTSVTTLFQGVAMCRFLVGPVLESVGAHKAPVVLDLWPCVGFLMISGALEFVAITLAALPGGTRSLEAPVPSVPLSAFLSSISVLFGYLPVLMYMQYVILRSSP